MEWRTFYMQRNLLCARSVVRVKGGMDTTYIPQAVSLNYPLEILIGVGYLQDWR